MKEKNKIAFFDTKNYDRNSFDAINQDRFEIKYLETKLNSDTALLAEGCQTVCAFVNDIVDGRTVDILHGMGVKLLALRCAGYNNVDFKAAYKKINVVRVPGYSPYAVAEHAFALLLCLNRKIHRAFNRTREYNFNISGLMGFDLHGKTMGVVGTGRIGRVFIDICKGFGMNVLAHDPFPAKDADYKYVEMNELLEKSDIISLHCPLNESTYHLLDEKAFLRMKDGAVVINTSRGALIDSDALLKAIRSEKISAAGLDVYEEESDYFYEDKSELVMRDEILTLLTSLPNVIVTSHQAFLTKEALTNIASTTLENVRAFFAGEALENEICYHCELGKVVENCTKMEKGRCF